MDHTRFDSLTRNLGRPSGRRQMLGAFLAGGLAILAGESTEAARRRKRKGRRKKAAADSPDQTIELPPGTLSGGIWDEMIEICHYNAETGRYEVTAVNTVTVPNYLNSGDTLYIDCCTDDECRPLPCLEPTSCVQGACAYEVTEGAPCALSTGGTGYCNSHAECVAPTYAPATTSGGESTSYVPQPEPSYDTAYDPGTGGAYDPTYDAAADSTYDPSWDTGYDPSWDMGYDPAAEPGY
jgi:hypothetical protein